jgi:hypothetical protein
MLPTMHFPTGQPLIKWRESAGGGVTGNIGSLWYFKDGKLVSDTSPGSAGSHGNRFPQVETRPGTPNHEGTAHVWSAPTNSTRCGAWRSMTVLQRSSDLITGVRVATGNADGSELRKGRVFHTTMGHDVAVERCGVYHYLSARNRVGSEQSNRRCQLLSLRRTRLVPRGHAEMDPAFAKGPVAASAGPGSKGHSRPSAQQGESSALRRSVRRRKRYFQELWCTTLSRRPTPSPRRALISGLRSMPFTCLEKVSGDMSITADIDPTKAGNPILIGTPDVPPDARCQRCLR